MPVPAAVEIIRGHTTGQEEPFCTGDMEEKTRARPPTSIGTGHLSEGRQKWRNTGN
jgi:hypothetical protein